MKTKNHKSPPKLSFANLFNIAPISPLLPYVTKHTGLLSLILKNSIALQDKRFHFVVDLHCICTVLSSMYKNAVISWRPDEGVDAWKGRINTHV